MYVTPSHRKMSGRITDVWFQPSHGYLSLDALHPIPNRPSCIERPDSALLHVIGVALGRVAQALRLTDQ